MSSDNNSVPNKREPELMGQTVVLIGGSAGIGLETSRRARSEGADVILTGRNPDRLNAAAADIGALRTAAHATVRCSKWMSPMFVTPSADTSSSASRLRAMPGRR